MIKYYYTEAKEVCFDANVSTENKQTCKSVSENRFRDMIYRHITG